MKKKMTSMAILIIFIALSLSTYYVSADNGLEVPHGFEGYVIDEDGNFYPDGTNVSAKMGDTFFNTTVLNGAYGSLEGGQQFIVTGYSSDVGSTIYFYVDEVQAPQAAIFTDKALNMNGRRYFNLSFDIDPPVISSVSYSNLGKNSVIIIWITDTLSDSKVNYGTTTALGTTATDENLVVDHEIPLSDLDSGTTYYFEVVSEDNTGYVTTDDNSGNYYTFTTLQESSGDGDGDGGGGNGGGPIGPINTPPVADSGGPYYGIVGESIYFDASNSIDSNGYIVNYTWDFGDGTIITTTNTGMSHEYSIIGNYSIILTVEDNGGSSDSDTSFVNISSDDSDTDGWSNEAEEYYGTDPNNSSDYPVDSDKDGVPDNWDSDDDNDGLTDTEEESIGTNKTNSKDVLRIINDYGLFYLLDIDNDNIVDIFYEQSTAISTDLEKSEENLFLIDVDNDGVYDYVYSAVDGEIDIYSQTDDRQVADNNIIVYILAFVIIIVLIIIIFIKFSKRKK